MQDANEFAKSITVKENLKSYELNATPKYYLTHNKDCTEFRQRVMQDAGDFDRGYLFGTACICNGAEDRILDKIEVSIERVYEKDNITVMTMQNGAIYGPNADKDMQALTKALKDGANVTGDAFSIETATEIRQDGF